MRRAGPILILLVGLAALAVSVLPLPMPALSSTGEARTLETKLGLDLQGGLRIEYLVQPAEGKTPTREDLAVLRQIILNRIDKSGVSEPTVVAQGDDRIVVEMPGVTNFEQIESLIGTTGRLDFVPLGATQAAADQELNPDWLSTKCESPTTSTNCVLFSGDQIAAASFGADQQGQRTVNFTLSAEGKDQFAAHTAANTGAYFPIEAISRSQVSPTLGEEFLQQSLLAGLIAVLMVIIFMVVHYRLPGVVASGALIFYALIVLALFRLIPVTLTLAGIAGFVLSVGMAVDANILIFERTKEELRNGKSLAQAIEAGFARAWNSILDSNVSSLITAMILYLFGSSVIQGFALVLIIGVLASMFTAITVTRTILRVIVN